MVRKIGMSCPLTHRMKANQAFRNSKLHKNEEANFDFMGILFGALALVGVILAAVIGMRILSSLAPGFISDGANLSQNISDADYGDATANSLAPTFGLLISLSVLFAIVGLVIGIVLFYRKRG